MFSPSVYLNTAFSSEANHGTGDSDGGDDNQGGDSGDQGNDHSDGSHGMPPPEDAPSTTDTITAGGGSDDDDSNQDDDNNDSNNDDDNKKNDPGLAAKEMPKCPEGQQYGLFSAKCEYIYSDFTPPNNDCPPAATATPGSTSGSSRIVPNSFSEIDSSMNIKRSLAAEERVIKEYSGPVLHLYDGFSEAKVKQLETQKYILHRVQGSTTESKPADSTNCQPGTNQPTSMYEPPSSALPYKGNEIELIESYDKNNIEVAKYDTNGPYGRFTFTDGTIKEGTYGKGIIKEDDTELMDIKIIPGPGTPLEGLGVKEARLPFSGAYPHVHYKDGNIVSTINTSPSDEGFRGQKITTIDAKGKVLGETYVNEDDRQTTTINPNDNSYSVYNADGSYVTQWPPKADGSQQFYDSKQQKVFVRDANGNIIPPK